MFEKYELRKQQILAVLSNYGLTSINEVLATYQNSSIDVDSIVDSIQPFAFDDVRFAFKLVVGTIIFAGLYTVRDIADCIGQILQAFCLIGSVSEKRKIGIGHGRLVSMLLDETVINFSFVAGHESFAAGEGALAIAETANMVRHNNLEVFLLGLGKPAADIISRYKGFRYIKTEFNHKKDTLSILGENVYGKTQNVKCYGANSVDEGVEILRYEQVAVVMTGNSTNHMKFTDPTVAIYKKLQRDEGKDVFCIASGGGTGRAMHPDNSHCGPASYGMTDTLGKTHSSLQFAGSSSVPSHVEMVGFIGIGNNPLVGLSISIAGRLIKANFR